MGLFRRSEVAVASAKVDAEWGRQRLDHLEAEVKRLGSELRQYQTEQVTMHDQVRKWMRRAVAAERAVDVERGESIERVGAGDAPARPASRLWGARSRVAARRAEVNGG